MRTSYRVAPTLHCFGDLPYTCLVSYPTGLSYPTHLGAPAARSVELPYNHPHRVGAYPMP